MRQVTQYSTRTKNTVREAINKGTSIRKAVDLFGIPFSTIRGWLHNAKNTQPEKDTPKIVAPQATNQSPGPRPEGERIQGTSYPPSFIRAAQEEMNRGISLSQLSTAWGITRGTLRTWCGKQLVEPTEVSLDAVPPEFLPGDPGIGKTAITVKLGEEGGTPTFVMKRGQGFQQTETVEDVDDDDNDEEDIVEETQPVRHGYVKPTDLRVENKKLRDIVVSLTIQLHELQVH